jgi:hypothetical protein
LVELSHIPVNQLHVAGERGQRVAVEADEDNVDDDAHLQPVLPVVEVGLLGVHQLKRLLAQQDEGGEEK